MSDAQPNQDPEQLIIYATPAQASVMRTRAQVVAKWCVEHHADPNELSVDQIMEIRNLPEWKSAS